MKIVYSLPIFIRDEDLYRSSDFNLLNNLLRSCQGDNDAVFVIYNQGILTNEDLKKYLNRYDINYEIIGTGLNIGIPRARQVIFQYVWNFYKDVEYQAELHVDMVLYKGWYEELIKYLEENPNEPCISPGIISKNGVYFMNSEVKISLPNNIDEVIELLKNTKSDKIERGFTHPVIHRNSALKEINGIDLRFFKGKQGFEDYSILIGYYNLIGSKNKWYPKMNGNTTVYHNLASQRWTVDKVKEDIFMNEEGLYQQYGAYGFKVLAEMLNDYEYMGVLYNNRVGKFIMHGFT